MTPKKKKSKRQYSKSRRRKHGSVFTLGQVLIILGAALMIAVAIVSIVYEVQGTEGDTWGSFTFGFINAFLGAAIAIVMAIIIIWLAMDKRAYYGLNLYLYAIIIMILALLGGNMGALLVLIGAVVIIFYKISRSN